MREENPIEVARSLLWNASINFIFLSRIEGEIPLLYQEVYLRIIFLAVMLLIWAKPVKSQMM